MFAIDKPIIVVSVEEAQVRIVTGDVPIAVCVSLKKELAIIYSEFSRYCMALLRRPTSSFKLPIPVLQLLHSSPRTMPVI